VDVFTEKYGRLSVVARGVRGRKKNTILQPFAELLIGVMGSSELKTLKQYEPIGDANRLTGEVLYYGMYINELLTRVLGRFDPMISLYKAYSRLLQKFSCSDTGDEVLLRRFEFHLLSDLGYGLVFDYELSSGDSVTDEKSYYFDPQNGFASSAGNDVEKNTFSGADLLAIGRGDYAKDSTKSAAKLIARQALTPLLGGKPLNSRELFTVRRS
jgi:DNA repair protein RecO (recombination protein O)